MGILTFQAAAGGALNLNGPNIAGTVNLTLPSADGTSGQPLQTNGSGTLSFANLAIANGGTGATSFTANQIHYGSFSQSAGLTYDGTNLATTGSFNSINTFGFKNRIINGGMVIDQRNAGAQITIGTSSSYAVDRFQINKDTVSGTLYAQQSTTVPSGFYNSLLFTANTAWTPAASDLAITQQKIEAFNTSDLGFGSASASTVTLSFWVRSSITGTYCAALINSANNRSYVATYTINAANTFEQKTITIAGDTSGTWINGTNGVGIRVNFDLGSGSTYNTTAGAWAAGFYTRTSGSVNWTQTSGATFYITGVQLEKGSTATSFDFRSYGTELALCQRYFEKISAAGSASVSTGQVTGVTSALFPLLFKVTKRDTPAFSTTGSFITLTAAGSSGGGTIALQSATVDSARVDMSSCTGLVSGNATSLFAGSAASLNFSAEL
jgi:hypothetical protein